MSPGNLMNPVGLTAWVMASGYASTSLLCLKVAVTRPARAAVQRRPEEIKRAQAWWLCCGAVLALLAVLAVWRLDLVLGDWLRRSLQDAGWYPLRRPLQVGALVFSVWLGWLVLSDALPSGSDRLGWPLLASVGGTSLLLFVGWGRLLSWHALDAVLNARWVGVSTGRWLEAIGLLVVAVFATWQWWTTDV